MSNIYTWSVNSIKVNPLLNGEDNVVLSVFYKVTGTDGINTTSLYFEQDLPYVSSNTFIPFNQLTEAQVISWGKNQLSNVELVAPNLSGIDAIQLTIDNQLTAIQISLITNPKLPWA